MTDISPTPSSYISDGELIAWLQEKSEGQYADLRATMNVSTQRGELMKELSMLKADIDGGKSSPQELIDEMEKIRGEYADTPYATEVDALLLPMETAYVKCLPPEDQADASNFFYDVVMNSGLPDEMKTGIAATLDEMQDQPSDDPVTMSLASAFRDEFSGKLQAEIDSLGRIDQLDLITIQKLMSDARQTSELGSNMLASGDQARNAIVGNIRG